MLKPEQVAKRVQLKKFLNKTILRDRSVVSLPVISLHRIATGKGAEVTDLNNTIAISLSDN